MTTRVRTGPYRRDEAVASRRDGSVPTSPPATHGTTARSRPHVPYTGRRNTAMLRSTSVSPSPACTFAP
ncbi:hypothetical protein, partial [Streptomyces sp. RP5T]|uniref:hypothetical protein n=1 Tax=Streptomyces sp. RP5T TaxID=2490848 RepID=UPI001C8C0EC5